MTKGVRATAADVVSTAISEMGATGPDVGDVLSGALAGVIWMWLRAGKDSEAMRQDFHRLTDSHFDFLAPLVQKEAAGGV